MATEANKFKVGAFLIAGFLVLNAALIWIGTSRVLERTERFVTYFNESVQGLDIGSAVKFRGVEVGRVESIGVAPDGRLVEVGMELQRDFRVAPGLRASLATVGITGISLVELGYPGEDMAPPELPFTPPGRYIPSQPSMLATVTAALAEVATALRGTDVQGLVADYRAVAAAARRRLETPELDEALARVAGAAAAFETLAERVKAMAEDPRLSRALDRIGATAERMEVAARSAQELAGDPRIPQALEDARVAAAAMRRSAEELRAEIAALRAGERLDAAQQRLGGTLDGLDATARAAAAGVRDTTDAAARAAARWDRLAADLDRSMQGVLTRMDRAAGGLDALVRSVEADPSRLLGKPPKEDFR